MIRLSILSSVKFELFRCLMAFEKVIVMLESTLILLVRFSRLTPASIFKTFFPASKSLVEV